MHRFIILPLRVRNNDRHYRKVSDILGRPPICGKEMCEIYICTIVNTQEQFVKLGAI